VSAPKTLNALLREITRVLRDPALFVWALFVLLIPFYVFSSGLPQPGDMLVVPLILLGLRGWNGRLGKQFMRPVRSLFVFTVWVLMVDWGWALLTGNFGLFGPSTFLLFPVYYVYNTLVFLVMCVLVQKHGARFLWLTLNTIFASVIMQVLATFVIHRTNMGVRGVGFFHNPNQLGFFALVSASAIALGRRRLGFGSFKTGLALTLCAYLALLSASRAAVLGIAVLFAVTVIANPRRLLVVALMMVGLGSIGGPVADAIDGTQQRLTQDRNPGRGFLEDRGYDRILANKEYWLLGAGEGGTQRFAATTAIGASEIHSSVGTLFFCYGIVGIALFGGFLYRVFQGAPLRSILILLPTLTYTIAHQGLRSTSAWIMFGVFVAIKHLNSLPAPPARAAAPRLSPARVIPV
jgi:hypothetical protein